MPKHSLEDVTGVPLSSEGTPRSKKSRKEKVLSECARTDAIDGTTPTGKTETKEERKERRRLKKLQKSEQQLNDPPVSASENDKAGLNDQPIKKPPKASSKATEKAGKDATTMGSESKPIQLLSSYTEDADLLSLPQSEVDAFLAKNFITTTDPIPQSKSLRPLLKFSHLPTMDSASFALFDKFEAPTPIQAAAWPYLLNGRDVVGVAETGSGKTMAFAVPCIRYISALPRDQRNRGARAVIISPTRELAMQSHDQLRSLAKPSGIETVCVYGGVPKDEQRRLLKTADIVVATPGRLNDLINEGYANLSAAKYVVLDEADRMLDKGFEEEIKKIVKATPPISERQTLMFTATWPESVRTLASTFMKTPVKIMIGDNPDGDLRANVRIKQIVEVVQPRDKEYRVVQLLKQHQSGSQRDDRILVFCLYKKEATRVEGFLKSKGFRVGGIHGDLNQEQRTRSLDAFKQGKTPILVATDVAARGLDIPAVKLVINCTFPLQIEDYVHRIGRTGRAGETGLAITLFTEHDKAHSGTLINVLKAAGQPIPDELLKFGTTVKKKQHDSYGAFFKDTDTMKTAQKIKFD